MSNGPTAERVAAAVKEAREWKDWHGSSSASPTGFCVITLADYCAELVAVMRDARQYIDSSLNVIEDMDDLLAKWGEK